MFVEERERKKNYSLAYLSLYWIRRSNGKLRLFSELSRTKEHDYQHNNDVADDVNDNGGGVGDGVGCSVVAGMYDILLNSSITL